MTPLEDNLYMALMAAKSFIQPRVRADLREMGVLHVVEQALKQYQDAKSPPLGKVEHPMDWSSVKTITTPEVDARVRSTEEMGFATDG